MLDPQEHGMCLESLTVMYRGRVACFPDDDYPILDEDYDFGQDDSYVSGTDQCCSHTPDRKTSLCCVVLSLTSCTVASYPARLWR